jgi:hypothetical protein
MQKQIPLFATEKDLLDILQSGSQKCPIEFVVAGLFDQKSQIVRRTFDHLRPSTGYLIFHEATPLAHRAVVQRNGGEKYAIDQIANPHSISLWFGGLHENVRLVASQIGTATNSDKSHELHSLFLALVRQQFELIKSYYVGPEAVKLLDRGIRLTLTAKSPEAYDLTR